MTVDYKDSIGFTCSRKTGNINGVNIGSMFLPVDLIKQLYETIYGKFKPDIEREKCKVNPDNNIYEYYQWDGNPESIKNVPFLKDIIESFKVSGSGFGRYHLDYTDKNDEIIDVYPGNYIVNRFDERRNTEISIYTEEKFKEKFIYK